MLNDFLRFIKNEHLFLPHQRILLAVSGGIDSVVLCNLFHRAQFEFAIAHCNFHLRGEESDNDEKFVSELASTYNVPFYCTTFETKQFATAHGISIQMAARQLRYDWFEELRHNENYDYIAVAHHLDDQVETFFINLLRGTGIAGLHGILPKQNHLIRPLMFCYRNDIQKYITDQCLSYREDSSNLNDKYLRNKIRHHLIPLLDTINPDSRNFINQDIARLRETEIVYRQTIESEKQKIVTQDDGKIIISIAGLKNLNPMQTYLFEFLQPYGFNFQDANHIIAALDGLSGKHFFSASHRLVKDRDQLIIEPVENRNLIAKLKVTEFEMTPDYEIPKNKTIASFDVHKLSFPLTLRRWQKGDWFIPFGMKTRKKISDYFIDQKFSIPEKENTWLLVSDNDIVWIIGHRTDNRFRVDSHTKQIYQVKFF